MEQLECSYTADGSVRDTKSILPYINYTLVICYMFIKLCSYQNRKVSLIHKVKKHAKWCYILLRDMCTCSKSIFTFFVCVSPKPQVKGSGYFRDEGELNQVRGFHLLVVFSLLSWAHTCSLIYSFILKYLYHCKKIKVNNTESYDLNIKALYIFPHIFCFIIFFIIPICMS